jgi:DNA end-binding protein Ku
MMPYDKGFLIKAILYKQQLRPFDQVEVQHAEVTDELVDKGMMLIERMIIRFDHAAYKESYTEALKEIIEAKAMGKEVKAEPVVKSAETRSLEAELERMLV